MRPVSPRVVALAPALFAACLALSDEAAAQSAAAPHARTLNWSGRPATSPIAAPVSSPARTAPAGLIPHAGADTSAIDIGAMPQTPDRIRRAGLTPADAWLAPSLNTAASIGPVYSARPEAAPVPAPTESRLTPQPAPSRAATAQTQASLQPPAPPPGSAAAHASPAAAPPAPAYSPSVSSAPADAMAPRADAPIFRLGRTNAEPPAPAPAPAQAAPQPDAVRAAGPGGRYYSVHRQNNRQPDSIQRPEPVYLDALPVEFADPGQTGQSEDLAAPPSPVAMMRDSSGALRPAPMAIEHDIQ